MMRKIILLLFVLTFTCSVFAQTKYLVYFKDKGVSKTERLSKESSLYKTAEAQLSERAIERRKKNMGGEIITYEDLPVSVDYVSRIESLNINIIYQLKWFNAVSCYLSDAELETVSQLPFVEKIEKVKSFVERAPEIETAPLLNKIERGTNSLDYGNSYNQMALSDVPAVHDLGINGEGVIIGFIDSGFNWRVHESTKNLNVLWEYDFVNSDNDPSDSPATHGTQTLAITCGYQPGQIIGPAYNADVMVARTEREAGEKNDEEDFFAAAVQEMENRGVDILTSSLGYLDFDSGQRSYTHEEMDGKTSITTIAYEAAAQRGVLTITSAGNEGTYSSTNLLGGITAPADGELTIAVGNVDSTNVLSSRSSRGPTADGRIKPEVVAMGTSVYSVGTNENSFASINGTSYAAPIVAGIAGQLYSAFPHLTNRQARQMLMESGDNVAQPDNNRGWGLASARKAVTYPNLESVQPGFKLHKIFIDAAGINTQTVKANYSINGGSFTEAAMSFDGNYEYTFDLPLLSQNDNVKIYFTYNTTGGTQMREPVPSGQSYDMTYGQLHINYATDRENENELPVSYMLEQNYPNPFNPNSRIKFQITKSGMVELVVYDLLGREVTKLVNEEKPAGSYEVEFDGSNLSSGLYFYTLRAGSFFATKKMILLK